MKDKRLDIQGLRALAVLLVILNHLAERPSGGFIGVDVFFVISGFLITGLLIRELNSSGRISFRRFYARRIKRILPAAALVLAVTVFVSYVLLPRSRSIDIGLDAAWSAVFGANWRLIATGTDYMHANDSLSPLQHYWSLSVEEQFYLVVPALLALIWILWRKSPQRAILATIAFIALGSFLWSMAETAFHPTSAYFSTLTRAWELGAGALLACGVGVLAKIPPLTRAVMSWSGLAIIVAGAILLTPDSPFPGPWALVPVIGATLVIAGGTAAIRSPKIAPLTNPVSVYIGTISYSLYLWHLPVIVLVGTLLPARGMKFWILAAALITLLSVITYHWIEDPLRTASWRRVSLPTRPLLRATKFLLPVLVVATLFICFVTVQSRTPASSMSAAFTPVDVSVLLNDGVPSALAKARSSDIDRALNATAWPALTPSVDELGPASRVPEWDLDGCLGRESHNDLSAEDNALRCVYGSSSATKTAAVIGDSVALSYVPAVRAALGDDWQVSVYTMSQCPAIDVSIDFGDEPAKVCADFRDWTSERLQATDPDLVIMSSSTGALNELSSGNRGRPALNEWAEGAEAAFKNLRGFSVVALDAPPFSKKLTDCAITGSSPRSCIGGPDEQYVNVASAARDAALKFANVSVPSTFEWFCNADGSCPAFIGSTPTFVDGSHLTAQASLALAPLMREALEPATR